MKKILFIVIYFLFSFSSFAGNYGVVIRAYIKEDGLTNELDYNLKKDEVSIAVGHYAVFHKDPKEINSYKFVDLGDTFDKLNLRVIGSVIKDHHDPTNTACEFDVEFNLNFGDFNKEVTYQIEGCSMTVTMYPIHISGGQGADKGIICRQQPVTLYGGYDWQYSKEGAAWKSLGRGTSKTITLASMFPDLVDYNIKFRSGFASTGEYTNVLTYNVIDCSPALASPIIASGPECYNGGDGTITLDFERQLFSPSNKLVINLHFLSGKLGAQTPTSSLQKISKNKYRYVWKSDEEFSPGTYYIKYQEHSGSGDGPDIAFVQTANFTIPNPSPVTFTTSNIRDANCHGGNDGRVTISANGGTGSNYLYNTGSGTWTNFNSPKNVSLAKGEYKILVKNGDCIAPSGTKDISIDHPDNPIKFSTPLYYEPTAYGFTNGSIKVTAAGGNEGFTYQWKNASNTQVSTSSTVSDIPAGTYTLIAKDNKYSTATDKAGCIYEDQFILDQPDPLEVNFLESTPISCNSSNTYGDPSEDGELTAVATGGVALDPSVNSGLDYFYIWKKKDSDGNWQIVAGEENPTLSFIGDGEYAVNIEDANGIILGTYTNNLLVNPVDATHEFNEPDLLEQTIIKQDVYCHGGSDGWVETLISGGTFPYQTSWSNGTTTVRSDGLSEGSFEVNIIDDRGCHVEGMIDVLQPEDPLTIEYSSFGRPSTIGADDGWVKAQIQGGTSFADQSYVYNWLDKDGNNLNIRTKATVITDTESLYQVHLSNIPAGAYALSIQDKNYASADTKSSCSIENDPFDLYDPIEASISIVKPISCHQDNEFNNPSSDGILQVVVDGGLKFSSGLPYTYHWKKKNPDTGLYELLDTKTTETAIDLSDGEYALNVEDALGIVMGEYESNNLIQAIDETFHFSEPDPIEISLSATRVSCESGNDGTAEATIIGGTGDYNLEWSNGESIPTIDDLTSGFYLLYLKDEKKCEASAKIEVEQPESLSFEIIEQKNPTCFEGNDGRIEINVTVGQPPYTYQWSSGDKTNRIENLTKGTYSFQVTDSKNCTAFTTIKLKDPKPIIVDLGEDRTLCQEQSHELDLTIDDDGASYNWVSDQGYQSKEATVALTASGLYTATVTTGKGCIGQDQIEIQSSPDEIDADFLLSSQAFATEEILLINTSNPLSTEVEWVFPDQAEIITTNKEQAHVLFHETGTFPITLRSIEGECYQTLTKSIVVEEPRPLPDIGDTETPFIQEFDLFPNPSNGSFKINVLLEEKAEISLRIYNMTTNQAIDDQKHAGSKEYIIAYDLQLNTGIYLLLLETPYNSEVRKIVIE